MQVSGHVRNGVVVFDSPHALSEGAEVTVTLRNKPVIHVSPNPQLVQFPLVKSNQPGTLELTNDRIAEILDEEDSDAVTAVWKTDD